MLWPMLQPGHNSLPFVRWVTNMAGTCCIYWKEAEAVAAFEGADPRIADKAHWRARHTLYEQLVALEMLSDDC